MHIRNLLLGLLTTTIALTAPPLRAADSEAPIVERTLPEANATLATLNEIEVLFGEEVTGVDASDLLINGVPATGISYGVAGQYVFEFAQPANGTIQVEWVAGHGITDLADPANAFAGGNWTYNLDPNAAAFQVRINELMADNEEGIRDEDGSTEDWIELYNAADTAVSLEGWYLTDNAAQLTGWKFPAGTEIGANSYLLIWASGKNRTNLANLHTDFQLAKGGEFLALVQPDGVTIVSSFSPAYPPQTSDVSFGRDRLDPSATGFYGTPTPNAANSTSGTSGFSPEVIFSRKSGTFLDPFELTLSTKSPTAVIHYVIVTTPAEASANTTNIPTLTSPTYTGPIPISGTAQIRARAFEPGLLPGTPSSESYIQITGELRDFTSDIPMAIVHNFGAGAVPTTSANQAGMFMVFDNFQSRSSLTNAPQVATRMGFHARGSSTLGNPKTNYRMEFWDEFNQDIKRPFLDMPEESDWVLYGINGFDPSLMHNAIFYWLGHQVGVFAPRTRYVEVFRKITSGPITTNDYFGLYLAVETPKQGKDRADIAKLELENTNSPAITGGYMLKIDRTGVYRSFPTPTVPLEAPQVGSIRPTPAPINFEEPKVRGTPSDPRLLAQVNYIENYIRGFITNLASVSYTNPVTGYASYINPDQWVNNLIANIIPFNVDGYRLSGYIYKDRNGRLEQGPLWDCDRCLGTGGTTTPQGDNRCFNPRMWRGPVTSGDPDNGTDFFGKSTVGVSWFSRLFADPDFWQRFIDRYQNLRTNELSNSSIVAMVDGFHNEIKEAQVREQSRWGGLWNGTQQSFNWPRSGSQTVNFSGTSYSYDFGPADNFGRGRFTNEVNFQKKWLLDRLDFMDTNFLAMPSLNVASNFVTSGSQVTVQRSTKPGTVIYYTLDGTDPRLPGGGISPAALVSAGDLTLTVTTNVRLYARCYNPNHKNLMNATAAEIGKPLTNSFWSGPVSATFYTAVPPLRITEIMYHPKDAPTGNTNDADNFEYLEVKNIGATPLNVNRFRIRGGIDFDFQNDLLAAGEQAVIVKNLASFRERYGNGPRVLGVYTNDSLSNSGERLSLEGGLREPILDFSFRDGWYPATDGHGYSLQIIDDSAATDTWGLKSSWRASGADNGTPSAADPGPVAVATIYVNEALTHTDPLPADAIELYNPTASAVNIGGWFLSDSFSSPKKYRIPDGTSISANGYIVFYQSNSFGTGVNGFGLSSQGDEVYVFSADAAGNLTGWAHGYSFGAQAGGVTYGRHITSTGEDRFVAQATPTLGSANSGPKVGPIVISEIFYHPPELRGPHGVVDNDRDEYIELHNTGSTAVPLHDSQNPQNPWRLRNAVDFAFPADASIPAGSYVLVVGFDPNNAGLLETFRQLNGVPAGTTIYGPWDSQLDNSQDNIELVRPGAPVPPGSSDAGLVPYILVDKVEYQDTAPWPTGLPDGLGAALGRVDLNAFGDDPANWRTAPKTPGEPLPTGGIAPQIVAQPVNTTGIEGQSASFTLSATGSALGYIWTFNGEVLSAASSPTLTLTGLKLEQAGTYACYVFNSAGSVVSSSVTLGVRALPRITQHPANVAVYIKPDSKAANLPNGTNVTFTIAATTVEPPLTYQWRFNGVPIPNATGTSFTVLDVQLEDEGDYDCVVTDQVAPVISSSARLSPWLSPGIVVNPQNITVAAGSDFSLSTVVTGNPTPFGYSWRRNLGSVVVNTNSGAYRTNFVTLNTVSALLLLTNNIQSSNFVMRLVVYNDANRAPGATVTFTVTVLEDTDRDGVPNAVEATLGTNPENAADADNDSDLDGMSNRDEFVAGTDPADNQSYLRIDESVIPGAASVQFAGISNRTYSVQYTDNLNNAGWSNLAEVPSRGTNFTLQLPDPTWTTNRFYRVVTPRQ